MSSIHLHVVKYSDRDDDILWTRSVPFTLESLQAESGVKSYRYTDHNGNRQSVEIDTDKVVDLEAVEEPPGPTMPSM